MIVRAATVRAVLVDLDGTLLDTVDDIAAAGNAMRAEMGRPALDRSTAAAFVGQGARMFVARAIADGLDGDAPADEVDRWLPVFMRHYERTNGAYATVYPGVREGLAAFERAGLPLACVTNKPRALTLALLERVGLLGAFGVVVAGGDTERRKPHPEPVLTACERLGVAPSEAIMIGDSINDVQAARGAGCPVLILPYGYNEGQPVDRAGADAIVATLADAARRIVAPAV